MRLKYEKLKELSKMHIARSPETEALYEAEEQLWEKVEATAGELGETLAAMGAGEIELEDRIALELASLLSRYGPAGRRAASLIVERWGEASIDEEIPAESAE